MLLANASRLEDIVYTNKNSYNKHAFSILQKGSGDLEMCYKLIRCIKIQFILKNTEREILLQILNFELYVTCTNLKYINKC